MNVGFEKIEVVSSVKDGHCILYAVYDVNHYFHTDYGRGYYKDGRPMPQRYNEIDYTRVGYVMKHGDSEHGLSGDGKITPLARLQAHWEGFAAAYGEQAPAIDKLPRKSRKKKYWEE